MGDAHASEVEATTKTEGAEPHDSLKTGDLRGLERALQCDCRRACVDGGLSTLRLQRLRKKVHNSSEVQTLCYRYRC